MLRNTLAGLALVGLLLVTGCCHHRTNCCPPQAVRYTPVAPCPPPCPAPCPQPAAVVVPSTSAVVPPPPYIR